jgi:cytidylate kinase
LFCCLQKASCTLLQSINKPFKALSLSLARDVILLVPSVCLLGLLGNLNLMLWAGIIADVGAFIPTIIFVFIEMNKLKNLSKESEIVKEEIPETKSNFVITIGREFGSGGKFIGQELAKRLNIKCYDNELISKVASDFNIDINLLESVDEKQKSSFWYGFANNYVFGKNGEVLPISPQDNLFLKQCKTIENLYDSESCIIIGRCADFILKDKPNVIKVFVYSSSLDFKIDRKVKFENLSETEAREKIKTIDKQRSDYYNHFTSLTWGAKENYNICIDTSILGVDVVINVIEDYVRKNILKKNAKKSNK